MCSTIGGYVPAIDYFSAAKRRNKHLKILKSVSRAYRKSEVRHLKAVAAQAKLIELQQLHATYVNNCNATNFSNVNWETYGL